MRWLTRHWGYEAEEEERAQVWSEYQAHLNPLLPNMPLDLADFARNDPQYNHRLWIHDSLMDRLTINETSGTIRLRLLQGDDPPIGNGLLTLIFEDAKFVEGSAEELEHWITAADTDFLWEEIDQSHEHGPRAWQVGFLLWPEGEFAISFTDFKYEWAPIVLTEGRPPRPTSVIFEE